MVRFIDEHRGKFGVEPICAVLPIAPSLYYERKARERDPDRRPAQARRDERLCAQVRRVWQENREAASVRSYIPQIARQFCANFPAVPDYAPKVRAGTPRRASTRCCRSVSSG
jgi:hypothetical protein